MRWIIIILIFIVIEVYAFQAFRTISKNIWLSTAYWLVTVLVLGNFIYQFYGLARSDFGNSQAFAFGFLIVFLVPKMIVLAVLFSEDIFRVPQAIFRYFTEGSNANIKYLPSRRSFISKIALGIAAIPFGAILYGMFKGKYNFKVLKYTLSFEDLPVAFDGYKLTQISDIHSGSFDNKEKVKYAVDLINEQESDVILFTGDIVNNKAEELAPYKTIFNKLKAKDGLFSVLGNHDYGDYVKWDSEAAKSKNLEDLKTLQNEIGFDVLLNESRLLEKNGERIALVGVENWGAGGFKTAGDLKQAASNIKKDDFKILMSHDPSHWEKKVIQDDYHYHLTLSGHTHGMQFGIEIPGWFKWSPVKWRYKYWAGIYEEMGQYINVNRGFGYLAFPGRVGIWPEITVIELKKGSNSA
ncbi:metallophosphoesterase [uncultured Algibacter sp.]|uniref:metallophosphoesterase n=1 Tax=uncultured Algibacter sp. TaxID=298659 RepID=UPI0026197CC8|nr:metallophosphoesterase [uncultured Algibacter sp.]